MKTNQAVYGIYIPSPVCFNMTISASAKLLYGEIAHRCQQQGYCKLSNQYFAKLYEVTPKTAANWVTQLEEAGYLRIRFDASGQQRLLYLEVLQEEQPITNQISLNL